MKKHASVFLLFQTKPFWRALKQEMLEAWTKQELLHWREKPKSHEHDDSSSTDVVGILLSDVAVVCNDNGISDFAALVDEEESLQG